MNEWFRSWHGAPTDPKWLAVAKRADVTPVLVSAVAWALFDYASQHEDRGSVAGFDTESYAVWSGASEDDVRRVIDAMDAKGIIRDGRLSSWEKRQPKREDDSTARVRAFRERQADAKRDVTPCNSRTEQSREETEQSRTEESRPPARVRAQDGPDQPWEVFSALCEELGTDPAAQEPAYRNQQLGIARALLDLGHGTEQVRGCVRYLLSQDWRTALVDLRTVKHEIGRWEAHGSPTVARARAPNGTAPVRDRGPTGADIARWAREESRKEAT